MTTDITEVEEPTLCSEINAGSKDQTSVSDDGGSPQNMTTFKESPLTDIAISPPPFEILQDDQQNQVSTLSPKLDDSSELSDLGEADSEAETDKMDFLEENDPDSEDNVSDLHTLSQLTQLARLKEVDSDLDDEDLQDLPSNIRLDDVKEEDEINGKEDVDEEEVEDEKEDPVAEKRSIEDIDDHVSKRQKVNESEPEVDIKEEDDKNSSDILDLEEEVDEDNNLDDLKVVQDVLDKDDAEINHEGLGDEEEEVSQIKEELDVKEEEEEAIEEPEKSTAEADVSNEEESKDDISQIDIEVEPPSESEKEVVPENENGDEDDAAEEDAEEDAGDEEANVPGDGDEEEEDEEEEEEEEDVDLNEQRKLAIEELKLIEDSFAELRDKLYQDKLSLLEHELQLCLEGNHPELSKICLKVNQFYQDNLRLANANISYKLKCIDVETIATRTSIHQNFMKNLMDTKKDLVSETTSRWYKINKERNQIDQLVTDYNFSAIPTIPNFTVAGPVDENINGNYESTLTKKAIKQNTIVELVQQRNNINQQLGVLNGLIQFHGFPSAVTTGLSESSSIGEELLLRKATPEEIDEDLLAMGIPI